MPLSEASFDYLRALVRRHSAVVLDGDKAYLAEARLLGLARREGCASVGDFVARLSAGPVDGLHREVVEAMTTNETTFFRDLHPFEGLRQVVLPEVLRRRAGERRLSIWSAACSSGQEPYSIAMLLREHFPALEDWGVKILASDLSTAMLQRARLGRYAQMEVNRGLPASLLVKYFVRQGLDWEVKDEVRRAIEFQTINLAGPWPAMPPVDVIFLRNVLIYFDPAMKKQILSQVRRALHPEGWVFLGGAETTLNLDDGFERVAFERFSCYRLRPSVGAAVRGGSLVSEGHRT